LNPREIRGPISDLEGGQEKDQAQLPSIAGTTFLYLKEWAEENREKRSLYGDNLEKDSKRVRRIILLY